MSKARKTAASSGEPDFWRVARDWLHHWLPKVRGSSPKTVEAYRIGLESYVRWLETTEGTQRRGCLIVCVWDHLIERKRSW